MKEIIEKNRMSDFKLKVYEVNILYKIISLMDSLSHPMHEAADLPQWQTAASRVHAMECFS